MPDDRPYLKTETLAALLDLSTDAAGILIRKIPGAFRLPGKRGHWRVSREDFEAWREARTPVKPAPREKPRNILADLLAGRPDRLAEAEAREKARKERWAEKQRMWKERREEKERLRKAKERQ